MINHFNSFDYIEGSFNNLNELNINNLINLNRLECFNNKFNILNINNLINLYNFRTNIDILIVCPKFINYEKFKIISYVDYLKKYDTNKYNEISNNCNKLLNNLLEN